MRYFIKVNDDKITDSTMGPFSDTQVEDLLSDGYIEISEEKYSLFNPYIPQKYIDNNIITDEEQLNKNLRKIELEKQYGIIYEQLQNTDYVVIKIAEGVATTEEYQGIINNRTEWRKQINELQKEIDKLK